MTNDRVHVCVLHEVKEKQYENTISKMLAWEITIFPVLMGKQKSEES